MKVTFISNYFNHHQKPFCEAMYKELQGDYAFVQTEPMELERVNMGWAIDDANVPYLLKTYENADECQRRIRNSDVIIIGAASDSVVSEHLRRKKLTCRYSERIYKKGQWRAISPRGIYCMYKAHANSKKRNIYMLCASAYTPCDLSIFWYYKNRMLKWGYFPAKSLYNFQELMRFKKSSHRLEILWCARFIDWKHPEVILQLAEYLKKEKMEHFHITMIGTGELRSQYEKKIEDYKLQEIVDIIGPLSPKQVREHMEHAHIFVATSDYNEGWGAVLNEAMSSACAVVSSHALGAAPYLIRHNKNGLIYKNGHVKSCFEQVCYLLTHQLERERMAEQAYRTIDEVWNADMAAKQFVRFAESVIKDQREAYAKEGPCSRAENIPQWKMYQYLMEEDKE